LVFENEKAKREFSHIEKSEEAKGESPERSKQIAYATLTKQGKYHHKKHARKHLAQFRKKHRERQLREESRSWLSDWLGI
jgi:hypothetical protein